MPFVFFALLGFPTAIGGYVSALSQFAALAFFILCGFFIIVPDQTTRRQNIVKMLKRLWLLFAILFVAYFAFSILYLAYIHSLNSLASAELWRLGID